MVMHRFVTPLLLALSLLPPFGVAQSIDGPQVDENGNVGVGTASPLTALDVRGDLHLDRGGVEENKIRQEDKLVNH